MTAQELKNSILQHAVQGKLVPQDPTDEPASVLLERIKAEKAQLIKDKKIKAEKPLAPITDEEIPFEIPESWEWVRLGEISYINGGYAFKSSNYSENGVRIIRISDFDELGFKNSKIVRHAYSDTFKQYKLEKYNILIAMTGGTVGKSFFVTDLQEDMYVNQRVATVKINSFLNNEYINRTVTAPHIKDLINKIKNSTNDNISMENINEFLIPLPPLAEQQRIVAKIEELMPLVEEYDKAEKELTELNAKFPEQIKKSVLQYAIQGKLVAQSEGDEPASELLKRIKAEKQQLIKEKKIKAEKPLPPITEEEIPFEIPESWMWVRLGEIAIKLTDGTHYTPKYTDKGIPFLSVKDMSSGKLDFRNTRFISPDEHKVLYSRCNPERGDLLLTKVGTTGIPIIVDTDIEFSLFVSVALIKFNNQLIYDKFLVHLINSPLVKIQCGIATKGVGNPNWVMRDIANTIIPLPPLSEQQRIVAKVEEVLGVCEGLK